MNVSEALNGELAVVWAGVKAGDMQTQEIRNLKALKGQGRIDFLLSSLAGMGLCDRSGKLTRLGEQTPANGEPAPIVEPDDEPLDEE